LLCFVAQCLLNYVHLKHRINVAVLTAFLYCYCAVKLLFVCLSLCCHASLQT